LPPRPICRSIRPRARFRRGFCIWTRTRTTCTKRVRRSRRRSPSYRSNNSAPGAPHWNNFNALIADRNTLRRGPAAGGRGMDDRAFSFESFRDSMPTSYRQQQSADEIKAHAQIVWRRGEAPAHVEIWTKRVNAIVVCVVTDDRPGLASLIRATIAAHGIDMLAAHG